MAPEVEENQGCALFDEAAPAIRPTPGTAGLGATVVLLTLCSLAWRGVATVAFDLSRATRGITLRAPTVVALTALGLFGLISAHGGEARGMWSRLRHGARVLWPALTLLALLPPIVRHTPPESFTSVALAVALCAALLPLQRTERAVTRAREWPLVTLAFAMATVVVYLAVGPRLSGSTDSDSAYYFGVARHIARTLRYEEPIVWQFLTHPKGLVHLPFDYWHGFVSLFFVPILRLFGSSFRVVGTTMAVVSSVSVLLLWYLISVVAPLRSGWLQVTSVLLFAFSPALGTQRFDSETVPFAHVWLLAALIAYGRGRRLLAVSFAFFMFCARADTVGLFAIVVAFVAVSAAREGRRACARILAAAAGWGAVYAGFHLLIFRAVAPPGARIAPFLVDGLELYRWHTGRLAQVGAGRLLAADYFDGRVGAAIDAFGRAGFFTHCLGWLGLAAAAGFGRDPSRRGGIDVLVRLLAIVGAVVLSWSTTPVFAFWRTLHSLLPVLVLSGAYGAEAWLDQLFPKATSGARPSLGGTVGHRAFACALSTLMVLPVRPYAEPPQPSYAGPRVVAATPYLGDGPVMSVLPWFVLVYAERPAVNLPINGEAAIDAAISAYGVRSLLLVGAAPCIDESAKVCEAILSGKQTRLGSHRLTKTGSSGDVSVFKISEE